MGRISGISTSRTDYNPEKLALAMLTSMGVEGTSNSDGFAAEKRDQIASFGPWRLVLDGAIYNAEDFPSLNHRTSPAERLLAAIDKEGLLKSLARLNGDFALALLDTRSNIVTLARDRFGVRPLYYTTSFAPFAFGSRPRSLLALPSFPRDTNDDFVKIAAAANYRFLDSNPERSPFKLITQVPAGHVVEIHDQKIHKFCYTDLIPRPTIRGSIQNQIEEYRYLLLNSIERRLNHSRRPIFTLSGGLDSSIVTVLAAKILGVPQAAISSLHEGTIYDESDEIADIVESGLVNWHPIEIVNTGIYDQLTKITPFHDQPVPTATWLNHFLLLEHAQKLGHESIFTGLGGDEQHGGEYDYFFYFFADLKASGDTERLEKELNFWIKNHNHPIFKKSLEIAFNKMDSVTDPRRPGKCAPDTDLFYKYQSILHPDLRQLDNLLPDYEQFTDSYLSSHMRNELLLNTMPCCLRAGDRNSSPLGLTEFHPFLDFRLFEFMLGIPGNQKIKHGVTKAFARKAYKGLLPERTRSRIKKTGWNAPTHEWFAKAGYDTMADIVCSRKFIDRGIYDTSVVCNLLFEHKKIVEEKLPLENHMMVLWQILTLEVWFQSIADLQKCDKNGVYAA